MRAGHAVTLYEMAEQPGGRAREVRVDGLTLDNGQHILIGAYAQTLRLMREVGVDPETALLRTPLRLTEPMAAACSCRRARRSPPSRSACGAAPAGAW